ncbi:MAG: integrase arm-type DNA-binding domain-containing protein [Gammaproteobacteria bacterium]|nr:integrase arm-type DNA-binding domain-containing protein [Gammaproteobacteria bacterium]MBU1507288.1 integrase arm-type DNA-binding domain-containing protein [Gammaproteobacteria bacterium]MBU2120877.1 integrase arm-type DNA-binding domain-containing protein [Gammaproteobacteria bacterium]MBU2169592.1 integrase arm-type DNA-binding domain-containing protein [Gammaproteobacteria bacterium]MBU2201737.1 integrase arm-type DNA-binding domain-containing protein [Gammaproteobacteria bacterium]
MPLTDTAIRRVIPGPKTQKLTDGQGMYLEVAPSGGKWWRLKYRIAGVEKRLSLGTYPDTSLKTARDKRDEARALIAQGIDPSDVRKASKVQTQAEEADAAREAAGLPAPNSFEQIAREWYETRREDWSPTYGQKIMRRLEVDVFPWLGFKPITSITPPMVLAVLRRVEGRGVVETAHRALENCGQVFRYAVATGQIVSNPARDLKDALRRPMVKHFPAITSPERLGTLLRAIHSYRGTPVVNAALKLLPMLLLRPGELRQGEWPEIDLEGALWSVPAARMKREKVGKLYGKPHLVPLARQAVAILEELHPVTGRGAMVFRGERTHTRPMSDAAINAALRAMGFSADEVTGHGFRATARTMLVERLGVAESVVEAQLAHSVKDSLGRAYNRTEFIAERVAMMQSWADYLDELRAEVPAV